MKTFTFSLLVGLVFGMPAFAENSQKILKFNVDKQCFQINFEQANSAVLSCQYPIDIEYTIRDCDTQKKIEQATNQAELTCPTDNNWRMRFRTTKFIVSLLLKVQREPVGKLGVVSKYTVQNVELD
jgi:hypothetical protein